MKNYVFKENYSLGFICLHGKYFIIRTFSVLLMIQGPSVLYPVVLENPTDAVSLFYLFELSPLPGGEMEGSLWCIVFWFLVSCFMIVVYCKW